MTLALTVAAALVLAGFAALFVAVMFDRRLLSPEQSERCAVAEVLALAAIVLGLIIGAGAWLLHVALPWLGRL